MTNVVVGGNWSYNALWSEIKGHLDGGLAQTARQTVIDQWLLMCCPLAVQNIIDKASSLANFEFDDDVALSDCLEQFISELATDLKELQLVSNGDPAWVATWLLVDNGQHAVDHLSNFKWQCHECKRAGWDSWQCNLWDLM